MSFCVAAFLAKSRNDFNISMVGSKVESKFLTFERCKSLKISQISKTVLDILEMIQNEHLFPKIGVDTAVNGPSEV